MILYIILQFILVWFIMIENNILAPKESKFYYINRLIIYGNLIVLAYIVYIMFLVYAC